MSAFNKVILLGNVTREVAVKTTPNGSKLAQIGLAVNRSYVQDGAKKEEVTFVDVTFWGKQAEVLEQYLKKGSPLLVEGRLKLETWEDESGGKRSKLSVVGENFQFVGGKLSAEDGATPSKSPVYDDEIPF